MTINLNTKRQTNMQTNAQTNMDIKTKTNFGGEGGTDVHRQVITTLVIAAMLMFAVNYGYVLIHEVAHAAVVMMFGGHVYGINVSDLGMGGYTEHMIMKTGAEIVLVSIAVLFATSLLAIIFALAGKCLLAVFVSIRTSVYAIDYAQGTDMSNIHCVIGDLSIVLSVLIVAANLACICYAVRNRQEKQT